MSNKFKINNGLIYTDGNQTNGYVLTSDANGHATWQASGGGGGGLWVVGSSGTDSITALGGLSDSTGNNAVSMGSLTTALGNYSFACGDSTYASGESSFAEGRNSVAGGNYSHCEGSGNNSGGVSSHAEGDGTIASGNYSHAEGYNTDSIGVASHAEGDGSEARGYASHAEGGGIWGTHVTRGSYSHLGGIDCSITSGGTGSFVHGSGSTVSSRHTYVFGTNINGSLENTMYVPNLVITGALSTKSKTLNSSGQEDDYNIENTSFLRVDTGGNTTTLTGIANGYDGRRLTIAVVGNTGSGLLRITDKDGSSNSVNQIIVASGAAPSPLSLYEGDAIDLIYDATDTYWRVIRGNNTL